MSEKSTTDTYVIALSGGVDSIVLLDALVNNRLSELTDFQFADTLKLVVAHFDHGIRDDSSSDERFARGVAGEYGLPYYTERVELGRGASEEQARNLRYNYLRQCCKSNNGHLITAHHQDDLLETMIINLIRGTGWRGLVSLSQISDLRSQILDGSEEIPTCHPALDTGHSDNNQIQNCIKTIRPLLNTPKSQILEYAKKYNLTWHEDSTNLDQTYLRNYVRSTLLPQMYKNNPNVRNQLLKINSNITELKEKIATELQNTAIKYQLSNIKYVIPRYDIIMWPSLVATEVIHHMLTQLDSDWHPSSIQIKRVHHFIKTGLAGKQIEVSKSLNIELTKDSVQFKKV